MGLQDKTLLPLLITLAAGATRDFIPWPEIVLLDLMCHLHQMGAMEVTPVELYNYILEPIRRHLHDPRNKTTTVWMSVDKRYVPVLKQNTSQARDTRAAAASASTSAAGVNPATDGDGEEEKKAPSAVVPTLPYPATTQVDEFGRVIFMKLLPTTTRQSPQYCIAGWPDGNRLVVSRLCSSRELRYKVFLYIFTKLAPLEARNLPCGTRLIISFTDDRAIGPIVVTGRHGSVPLLSSAAASAASHAAASPGECAAFYNGWPEADHDQPAGLRALLREREEARDGPRALSVLACSVDSDMYGIWSLFLSHPRFSTWVNGGLQLYFWNMNPIKGGPNARVIDMTQFAHKLQAEHCVTSDGLGLFMHVLGNDYTKKQALTPRISAQKAWPRFVQIFQTYGRSISPILDSPETLAKFLRALGTDTAKGKEEKAVVAALKDKETLAQQFIRIQAGLRLWRLSFCEIMPPADDEWLQPMKPKCDAAENTTG